MNDRLLPPPETLRRPRARRVPWGIVAPCAALAFALACAFAAREASPGADAPEQAAAFRQLAPEGAGRPVSVRVQGGGEDYTLVSEGDGFRLEGEALALDPARAQALLSSGASILGRNPTSGDRDAFGLGEGALCAQYVYEDGRALSLRIGDAPASGGGRYAQVEGENAVYVVNASLYALLGAGRYALAALPELPEAFAARALLEATIRRPGAETVTIRRVTERNPFSSVAEFTQPVRYPANAERAGELFLSLEALAPSALLSPDGADADYGLDSPLAEIELTGAGNEKRALTLGESGETLTLRIGGDAVVYALPPGAADFLQNVTVPYLAEQLPGLVALDQVERVTLRRGAEIHVMEIRRGDGDDAYAIDGRALAREDFLPLYQAMIGLLIDGYARETDAAEGAAPAKDAPLHASFEYSLLDGTVWTLGFADGGERYDRVVREGETSFIIAKGKVDAVFDGIDAVLEAGESAASDTTSDTTSDATLKDEGKEGLGQ